MSQNEITRREFIKSAAVAGAAVAASGVLGAAPAAAAPVPDKWDREADVVVVGMGLGALCAAIIANDSGAKVLILEKAPEGRHGGTSRVSLNLFMSCPPELEGAMYQYLRNQDYAHLVDEDVHKALAAEMTKIDPWIQGLGGEVNTVTWPPVWDVPGKEACIRKAIGKEQGYEHGWRFFESQVKKRSIPVLYATPATSLVATPEGEVRGVLAENPQGKMYIKARRGVVLGTGGFEANPKMLASYAMGVPLYYDGNPYNTGDGIRMAQALGADIVQMSNIAAPRRGGCIKVPGFDIVFRVSVPGNSLVYVNRFGERFINEFKAEAYSHGWRQLLLFDKERMTFPTIPWYVIFDQAAMDAGPLARNDIAWNPIVEGYKWSAKNQTELAKGWILKADSLDQVASQIAQLPGNQGKMQASTLKATLDAYSQACKDKKDSLFGRPAANLAPIAGPPFYFLELWPLVHNTQGGPKRDTNARIVNTQGKPIPRLYSVGEMGSWWGSGYDGGFIEGPPSGRIAGRNVVAEKPWDATA